MRRTALSVDTSKQIAVVIVLSVTLTTAEVNLTHTTGQSYIPDGARAFPLRRLGNGYRVGIQVDSASPKDRIQAWLIASKLTHHSDKNDGNANPFYTVKEFEKLARADQVLKLDPERNYALDASSVSIEIGRVNGRVGTLELFSDEINYSYTEGQYAYLKIENRGPHTSPSRRCFLSRVSALSNDDYQAGRHRVMSFERTQ
ncbi:hypothetical protein ACHAQJ_001260 [Trichoderma viride]